ncbi:insulinase family protein [Arthrobacter celericrescens]|uniref:insulinase family protein n=1 Tax=Arthrobacter celericrescens TaxID=2320851 RepID=UPI000EA3899F|nr:insulinase family protein [Arthrobacter celericrescens]
MTQKVQTGLHNGIPTYSLDAEGPCLGSLRFGVGLRDEPAVLAGITHLVEHLLLRATRPMTVLHGAMTDTDSVEFWARGEPADVADFLNVIADAVSGFSGVSEEDIVLEKAVVEAEDPNKFRAVSSGLMSNRFGTIDLGAAHFGAPATQSLTKTELLAWAGQWLVMQNAALTFSGRIPGSLEVRLPSGSIPERTLAAPLVTEPTLIVSTKDGVGLSLLVPAADAAVLAEALRYELQGRLSHDRGLIYWAVDFQTTVDEDKTQLDLILDPTSANIIPAFDLGVATLHEVVRNGFTEEAFASARKARIDGLEYGRSVPDWHLEQLAVDGLRGRSTPTLEAALQHVESLTVDRLTASLSGSMDSLMVAVAGFAKPRRKHAAAHGLAFDRFRIWQDSDPGDLNGNPAWRNKGSKETLCLTTDRLLKRSGTKTQAIALADVSVVGDRNCGCVFLMDRLGRSLDLDVTEWKNGKELRKALLAAFPAEVVRAFPAD